MRRVVLAGYAVIAVVAVFLVVRLLSQQSAGPPHQDIVIGDGVPATLYTPPNQSGEPVPVVVIGHGLSGDRTTMSPFARSLAETGYAALTIDFSGHGANSNAGRDLTSDYAAAFDWLATTSLFESARAAVLGHSMGAFAAMDFAAEDTRPAAVVAISGGEYRSGGRTPRSVLFLVAENDPGGVLNSARGSADRLRDGGSAVRVTEIESANHLTILWSDEALKETVAWLNTAFDRHATTPAALNDPRLGTALAYVPVALLLLSGIGFATGRLASTGDWRKSVGPVLVAAATGALVFVPLGPVIHRLIPTPQRMLIGAAIAILTIPFFVAFHVFLRSESLRRSAVFSIGGHGLLLATLVAGAWTGALPGFLLLIGPVVAALFAVVEIFAAAAYAASRHAGFIGAVEGLWIAGATALTIPL